MTLSNLCSRLLLSNGKIPAQEVVCTNGTNRLSIPLGRRRVELDGHLYWLCSAPSTNWYFAVEDLEQLALVARPPSTNAAARLRVVVDAGHGGTDDGAIGVYPCIIEKDLTLDIARRVQDCAPPELDIVLTRTNDCALPLPARVAFAGATNADLFVSIHANFASNTNASGVECYAFPPAGLPATQGSPNPPPPSKGHANAHLSAALGWEIHTRLCDALASTRGTNGVDRGLKRANFHVLRENPIPATLVELGFLSNEVDSHALTNTHCRAALAQAIVEGLAAYGRALPDRRALLETFAAERMERERQKAARRAAEEQARLQAEKEQAWAQFKLDTLKQLRQAKERFGARALREWLRSLLAEDGQESMEQIGNESDH
ncbi:MAG: N-acetylmuramoyl-L-alanine amidase [Kiritimatiellia bacterium]